MVKLEQIVSLAKRRGFVFPGSEIYGGLANSWDYGPLGIEMKNNIKRLWWKKFVQERLDVMGLDSAILMNAEVWKTSGHTKSFADPMIDCKTCKNRFRADDFIEKKTNQKSDSLSVEDMTKIIIKERIACPICGNFDFTSVRNFNLMFQTLQGVSQDSSSTIYLRPETAQGIFVNFKNIQKTMHRRLPFGIAQIGKSFRNEITPGNFIFRTTEFEQMEIEYFCKPDASHECFEEWVESCINFLLEIGVCKGNFFSRTHSKEELSHYSQHTVDIEYKFPFGTKELWGIAHRGDYDLQLHQNSSKKELLYFDTETKKKYFPHCIEPSLGLERLFLALLIDVYKEDIIDGEKRVFLDLLPSLAPIKVAILPLSKKFSLHTKKIFNQLKKNFPCDLDETASIGKRYRRQDEIGTPYCITFDFESLKDEAVTVRERNTTKQERVAVKNLQQYLMKLLN